METQTLAVGQRVKYAAPSDAYEAQVRYVVLEVRGSRILVQIADWPNPALKPQSVYFASDLSAE